MNTTRRLAVLAGTVLAMMVGSSLPASATYADSVSLTGSPMSIATGTVAAPTQVEAKPTCTTTYDPLTGTSTTSATIKIEWWQSGSRGVSGYLIMVYPAGKPAYELTRTGRTDEVFEIADQQLLDSKPRFSVTTLTSYGWTAESTRTATVIC
jgi:hypothetical protein